MTDSQRKPRELGLYLALGQVGLEMVAPIVLGFLIDRWLRTLPWLTVVGVLIGFVGGLVHLSRLLKRWDRVEPPNLRDET